MPILERKWPSKFVSAALLLKMNGLTTPKIDDFMQNCPKSDRLLASDIEIDDSVNDLIKQLEKARKKAKDELRRAKRALA